MKSNNIKHRIGLTFSALSLALLTACGGGGSEPAETAPPPQTASAATTTICGVQMTATEGPAAHQVSSNQTMMVNGYETLISLVTSATGYPYDGGLPVVLSLPLEDLREAPFQGYSPHATLDSMGVELGSRFKAGAVGCVGSVSRANNLGTTLSPNYLLSWASATLPSVPLADLPSNAINGFEFLNNFESTQATAVFRMDKSNVADPANVRICHINSSGSTHCNAPTVTQDALQWIFKLPITAPGVYLISAPREEVPLD